MSQIISIHIGGSGTKLGISFWQELNQKTNSYLNSQHDYNYHHHNFYDEDQNNEIKLRPRAIFVDHDIRSTNLVMKSDINVKDKNCISRDSSCWNLFADGYCSNGAQLKSQIEDAIRKQQQIADKISGFILTRSMAGGCGSGLGSKILQIINEKYNSCMCQDVIIYQGNNNINQVSCENVLTVYNQILGITYAIQHSILVYPFENKAGYRILEKNRDFHANFQVLNKYYGHCLNEHVSPYLESGDLNTNQRKRAVNLLPFPRVKFVCGSLSSPKQPNYLFSALNKDNKLMSLKELENDRIMGVGVNVKDSFSSEQEINQLVAKWENPRLQFVEWINNSNPLSISLIPHHNSAPSAWILTNSTKNVDWFKDLSERFGKHWGRRDHIFHYLSKGMDEMQFVQAESNMNDIISEYTPPSNDFGVE